MAIVTRLYETYEEARRAIDAVNALGHSDVEVSILGNEAISTQHRDYEARYGTTGTEATEVASGAATGAGIGAALGGGAGLLAGLGMLAIPGLGPLVAAGWVAAAAAGAAGGALAGGAIGALTDLGIPEEEAPVYSEAIRRGGVMVSARFPEERRASVEAALSSGTTAAVSDLRSRYETEGWRVDETEEERQARLMNTRPPII